MTRQTKILTTEEIAYVKQLLEKNNYSQRLVFKKDIPVNYYSKAKEIHVKAYSKKDS
jgi:hypothetical protein